VDVPEVEVKVERSNGLQYAVGFGQMPPEEVEIWFEAKVITVCMFGGRSPPVRSTAESDSSSLARAGFDPL
jgi:hypothetical protein